MQQNSTAVAVLLVCAVALPVALTTNHLSRVAEPREPGVAPFSVAAQGHPAARIGSVAPFIGLTTACSGAACDPGAVAEAEDADAGATAVRAGERYPGAMIVTEPGRYGLTYPAEGETYAIVGSKLVRINRESFTVLSILRSVE